MSAASAALPPSSPCIAMCSVPASGGAVASGKSPSDSLARLRPSPGAAGQPELLAAELSPVLVDVPRASSDTARFFEHVAAMVITPKPGFVKEANAISQLLDRFTSRATDPPAI